MTQHFINICITDHAFLIFIKMFSRITLKNTQLKKIGYKAKFCKFSLTHCKILKI